MPEPSSTRDDKKKTEVTLLNRILKVQDYVENFLQKNEGEMRAYGFIHLYCVSQACSMLALKRGENVELACIAGLLHDVSTYKNNDIADHAHKGAILAEGILRDMKVFTEEEIQLVCQAIYNHSDKAEVHAPLDEILKDADVLQHCLYDPLDRIPKKEKPRYAALKEELGMKDSRE